MRQLTYSLISASLLTASSIVLAVTATSAAPALSPTTPLAHFTPVQRQELKQYMANYIMQNPQVIVASVQRMQAEQQMNQVATGRTQAIANAAELVQDKVSPTIHNGPVTLVEFFDYQCSVCHMMQPTVDQFIKAHPNVRVVFKSFPIFGPASQYAAKVSIAAAMQGSAQFIAFHNAMFKSNLIEGKLTNNNVDSIAKKSGLNMLLLKKDMQLPAVSAEIKSTYQLAQKMALVGTPAFVILPTDITNKKMMANVSFIPGGTQYAGLEQALQKIKQ